MDYDLWSGGEYGESSVTSLFTRAGTTAEVSSDYAHNGNTSIKLSPTGTSSQHYIRYQMNIDESDIGKTCTFKVYLLSQGDSTNLILRFNDASENSISNVSVTAPTSNDPQLVTLTSTIPDNTAILRINIYDNIPIYIDNWEVSIQ